jgi:hypothetical protein
MATLAEGGGLGDRFASVVSLGFEHPHAIARPTAIIHLLGVFMV